MKIDLGGWGVLLRLGWSFVRRVWRYRIDLLVIMRLAAVFEINCRVLSFEA